MSLPSPIDKLASALCRLPGIGEKSARRIVFFLLAQPEVFTREFSEAVRTLKERLHPCPECGNFTEDDPCPICTDPLRDRKTLCVVETAEDLVCLEQASVFGGVYHVLGGRVSPLDGEDIDVRVLESLKRRIQDLGVKEVIIATNPCVEGDLTYFAVVDALKGTSARLSRLAYGLPVGGSIGYADRVTLHAALEARQKVADTGS
ncbi:MAG: recombination mediator RecR [Synergistales bacterium]